jgi:phosphohistidine phosphatase SixA
MLVRSALLFVLVVTSSAKADESAWKALKRPGAIAVMRHALAPGTGDPPSFVLDDCLTQRNLDDRGRQQARKIGDAFRARGIGVDRVFTSQWCRCRETAELLNLGSVEELPALNSFFADGSTRAAQTAATGAFLRGLPELTRVVLVTHQVNITALTGVFPSSGEVVVGRMGPSGFAVQERIRIQP